ncbi:hypothetical protein VNO77_11152 [Canavalia gladiata]|uniref:Uncharacterized protein n=1 Tax=Canavalia gladiata TaxID=3824 RepID=A0AAN9QV53_CANGL
MQYCSAKSSASKMLLQGSLFGTSTTLTADTNHSHGLQVDPSTFPNSSFLISCLLQLWSREQLGMWSWCSTTKWQWQKSRSRLKGSPRHSNKSNHIHPYKTFVMANMQHRLCTQTHQQSFPVPLSAFLKTLLKHPKHPSKGRFARDMTKSVMKRSASGFCLPGDLSSTSQLDGT